MTTTAAAKRRIIAAASAVAALALLVAPLPSAIASADASAPAAAKARAAKTAAKAPTAAKATAATAADFTSIFAGQAPALVEAGWAACSAPITWSIDTRGLSADEATAQIANMEWAFSVWSQASGLSFQYTGTTALTYNDSSFSLKPADGSATPSRHVYLAFVADSDSDRMGGGVVGLGSPSTVWPTTKEIVSGAAVFRTDHVKKVSAREAKALYLHELGHVLGLGHADDAANIMYGVVADDTELGAGDTNGVRAMTKPCKQAA